MSMTCSYCDGTFPDGSCVRRRDKIVCVRCYDQRVDGPSRAATVGRLARRQAVEIGVKLSKEPPKESPKKPCKKPCKPVEVPVPSFAGAEFDLSCVADVELPEGD